jgi:hypothetical protein
LFRRKNIKTPLREERERERARERGREGGKEGEREGGRERIKEEVLDDVLILYTHREYILQMCMYIHTHIENQRLVIHSVLVSSSIHQPSNPLGS